MSEYKPMIIVLNHSQKAADKIKPYVCELAWQRFYHEGMLEKYIINYNKRGYAINVTGDGHFSMISKGEFKRYCLNKKVLNLYYHKRKRLTSDRLPK